MSLKVFQIVGFKNSGKTTAMCQLIDVLTEKGYKVASLKHHHVQSNRMNHHPKTDTGKHLLNGAVSATLSGPIITEMQYKDEPGLEAYVAFYQACHVDVLLIEGFKNADFPKAVMLRSQEDYHSLKDLENIQLFITQSMEMPTTEWPCFHREDVLAYTSYILKCLEGQS